MKTLDWAQDEFWLEDGGSGVSWGRFWRRLAEFEGWSVA
jgi:hypothetical protein